VKRLRDLSALGVAALACGIALAACSSGGASAPTTTTSGPQTSTTTASAANQSASEIAAASKAAMLGLSSVHIVGAARSGGQNVGIVFTLTSTTSSGIFAFPSGALEVLVDGSSVYARGTQSFWSGTVGTPAAVAGLLAGRWVTGIPAGSTSQLTSSLNLASFIGSIFNDVTLTKGPTTTVLGQSAIPLIGSDGSTSYVAAEGTPYLLKVTGGSSAKGTIVLSRFNTATPPTVPTKAVNFATVSG
jgi:hypothetical protein